MNEVITDELVDNIAEEYLALGETNNRKSLTFEGYLEWRLSNRKEQMEKATVSKQSRK